MTSALRPATQAVWIGRFEKKKKTFGKEEARAFDRFRSIRPLACFVHRLVLKLREGSSFSTHAQQGSSAQSFGLLPALVCALAQSLNFRLEKSCAIVVPQLAFDLFRPRIRKMGEANAYDIQVSTHTLRRFSSRTMQRSPSPRPVFPGPVVGHERWLEAPRRHFSTTSSRSPAVGRRIATTAFAPTA